MKFYHGERTARGCEVTVNGRPLQKRSDLTGNATTPFDWGYIGSGQLSVALLSDFLGDDAKVKALVEVFEQNVVAELPMSMWTRTDQDFAAALKPLTGVKCSLDGGGSAGAVFGDIPVGTANLGAEDAAALDAMLNEGGPCQMQ